MFISFLYLNLKKEARNKQTNQMNWHFKMTIAWLLEAGLKQTYNENGQIDKNKCGDILFAF